MSTAPADPREALAEYLTRRLGEADMTPTKAAYRALAQQGIDALRGLAARQDEPSPALREAADALSEALLPDASGSGLYVTPFEPVRDLRRALAARGQGACPLCRVGIAQQEPDLHLTGECGCDCHQGGNQK